MGSSWLFYIVTKTTSKLRNRIARLRFGFSLADEEAERGVLGKRHCTSLDADELAADRAGVRTAVLFFRGRPATRLTAVKARRPATH